MNAEVANIATRRDGIRKSIFGIVSIVLSLLGILIPIVAGPNSGDGIDIHARYIIPWAAYGLAALAFVRRERAVWPILGIVVGSLYLGLHFITMP